MTCSLIFIPHSLLVLSLLPLISIFAFQVPKKHILYSYYADFLPRFKLVCAKFSFISWHLSSLLHVITHNVVAIFGTGFSIQESHSDDREVNKVLLQSELIRGRVSK
jgi:hypothetical protein